MVRKIVIALVVIMVLVGIIYILIPATIKINASTGIKCTIAEFNACVHNSDKWNQWFPTEKQDTVKRDSFYFNQYSYSPGQQFSNGIEIRINGKLNLQSKLNTFNLNPDSILVNWSTSIIAGNNPFKRVQCYFQASDLKNNMDVILDSLTNYAVKPINVYGFNIRQERFEDSLLVSTKKIFTVNPDVNQIYEVINAMRSYILLNKAAIVDSPMIHIKNTGDGNYMVNVAIGINHEVPENSYYSIIRMVINSRKYISVDVYGGRGTLENAHRQVDVFMKDHSITSPAIPFEILKTDRSKITDTSKWVTRIYYPST